MLSRIDEQGDLCFSRLLLFREMPLANCAVLPYVKMAVAWAASMCYAAFPDETLPWLQAARLDEFTYRRTIRKICESHQVNAEQKSHLRALERRRQG